jgi:hypothetical protein
MSVVAGVRKSKPREGNLRDNAPACPLTRPLS